MYDNVHSAKFSAATAPELVIAYNDLGGWGSDLCVLRPAIAMSVDARQ